MPMAQRRPVSGEAGEVATLDDEDEKKTKALQPTTPDLTRGLLICTGLVVCQTIVDVVIEIPKARRTPRDCALPCTVSSHAMHTRAPGANGSPVGGLPLRVRSI